jgi:hypothetical protein
VLVANAVTHHLRHTHVALCIQAHMNLKTIQTRLGHFSIRVTRDRYAHLLQAVEGGTWQPSTTCPNPRRRLLRNLCDPLMWDICRMKTFALPQLQRPLTA